MLLGQPVTWIGSPNYSPGRNGHNVDWTPADQAVWIVLHTMVGWRAGTRAAFLSAARQASSTYGAMLDGSRDQYVKESDGPWTNGTMAGVGSNLDAITIECEDGGDYNGPRTPALYQSVAQLVADIASRHNIPLLHRRVGGGVIGHHECDGSSTACPDSLDIDRVIREAIEYQAGREPYAAAPVLVVMPPAVPLVKPAKPIPGVVFDTPTNDRSFLIYDSNTFDMGNVAEIGLAVSWTEAKWTADHGWLLKVDATHGLMDECVDDSAQATADGHDGKNSPPDFAPPAAPVDTRAEWLRNLFEVSPTVFRLYSPVPIVKLDTGTVISQVPPGPLTVDHQTVVKGVAYWLTSYGATAGHGLAMTAVAAAAVAPLPTPQILPIGAAGGTTASGGGVVVVVSPATPPATDVPSPPGGWQAFLNWLRDLLKAILGRP
jgi:hypothetical protein